MSDIPYIGITDHDSDVKFQWRLPETILLESSDGKLFRLQVRLIPEPTSPEETEQSVASGTDQNP